MRFFNRLYLRIWLAIVSALVVLSLLVLGAWHQLNEDGEALRRADFWREGAAHEVIIYSPDGQVQTTAQWRFGRGEDHRRQVHIALPDGRTLRLALPARAPRSGAAGAPGHPPPMLPWAQWGFAFTLLILAIAVALGVYPIVRRMTRRLEELHRAAQGLEKGDFSVRVNVQGSDEIAALSRQFNRTTEKIQGLVQAQRDLLANASHELRSPLTRMRMSVELMRQKPSEVLFSEMQRSIVELDELVDEILLASRLDAQLETGAGLSVDAVPVDLIGLAAEECARVHAKLHVVGAEVVEVKGSGKLLRRLLRNLLENAARHVPKAHGQIHCILENHNESGVHHRRLWLCDNGSGVAPHERERIFESFYRPRGSAETQGNVGLGLALVRRIAQQHGASVTCTDAHALPAHVARLLPPPMQIGAVFCVVWAAS